MRIPDQISIEAMANAVRKPVAVLATTATLAAGVALQAPAVAYAHPTTPNAPGAVEAPKASPAHPEQNQDNTDPTLLVAAGAAILVCAVGAILTVPDRDLWD